MKSKRFFSNLLVSSRANFFFLILFLGFYVITGCGELDKQDVRVVDRKRAEAFGALEIQPGFSAPAAAGQLVFRSFKKQYLEAEVRLGIKLGWFGFGTSMNAGTGFIQMSQGGVVLNKVPLDDGGAIFADDQGSLQVRPGEEFTGFCVYESSYGLALGAEGEISFAGSRIAGEMGRQKILGMEVVSPMFPIEQGSHLGSLEVMCENLFNARYQQLLQKDLGRGLRSQMVIHRHFDPRIQALEKILRGEMEKVVGRGEAWAGSGVEAQLQDGRIRVKGAVEVGRKAFHFDHVYRDDELSPDAEGDKPLILESSSVTPKALEERYQKALVLAGYLARNKAQYESAVRRKKTYTVDDSLLKAGF